MADEKKPDIDDLADRLVPDPTNPDVRRMVGFLLGKSHRDDHWRLYLNGDLTQYLEFRKADTVHAKQISGTQTVVWVKAQTRVQLFQTGSMPVEFLRGVILEDQLSGARMSGLRRAMGVAMAEASGCAHCQNTPSCPCHPGTGVSSDTAGFSCGC